MKAKAYRGPAAQASAHDLESAPAFNLGWIWTVSLVAALGGLLFGYDWVVIGGAEPFYKVYFELKTAAEEGWAMSAPWWAAWSARWLPACSATGSAASGS